jgi:tetratricopeptide (TPR) repeat protein
MRYDYEYAFFEMVITDNQAGVENTNSAYLDTKDASNEDNKNVWAAYCEFIRLLWGKGGSLENLKALAELYPDSSRVWKYLAMGFEKYHDYRGVAHAYETAAIKTEDKIEQVRLLGRAAIAYTRSGAGDVATEIVNRMKAQVQESGAGEVEMISALKEISEIKNDDEALLAIMERMMDLDPSDTKTRFSLAYKHSIIGNDDLALFHYLQIPFDERDSMTWNNLGVAFDRFDLSVKSILAYRKAEGSGETLAMSNLASKLITAGFLSEAEQICKNALKVENYHKNITHTMARLKDKPDEENKKEADLLAKTKPLSDFYTEFGRALSRDEPGDLAKCWQGPNCILDVTLQGSTFEAVGFYEVPTSGLLSSVRPEFSGSISKVQTVRYQVNYHGSLRGRAIEASVIRKREGDRQKVNSLLSSNETEVRVLMTLSDDGNEFRVMEKTQGTNPRFYTLKREASI